MLSLLQHDLTELVDDEVLAYASNSILAILLGVDADNASRLLEFVLIDILVC